MIYKQNKNYFKMLISIILILSLFMFTNCEIGNDSNEPVTLTSNDAINIISVSPNTGLKEGVPTQFIVRVSYALVSLETGELEIGFNNSSSVSLFHMISSADKLVGKGTGEHTFDVTTSPKNWSSTGSFEVYVNLSPYPNGSSWIPLANDYEPLTF